MFPAFQRTFTPQNVQHCDNKLNLPKPWKFYTIQDGVDGDILQVCPHFPSSDSS